MNRGVMLQDPLEQDELHPISQLSKAVVNCAAANETALLQHALLS